MNHFIPNDDLKTAEWTKLGPQNVKQNLRIPKMAKAGFKFSLIGSLYIITCSMWGEERTLTDDTDFWCDF